MVNISNKTKFKTTSDLLSDHRAQSGDITGGVDIFWKGQNATINKMVSALEKSQWHSL